MFTILPSPRYVQARASHTHIPAHDYFSPWEILSLLVPWAIAPCSHDPLPRWRFLWPECKTLGVLPWVYTALFDTGPASPLTPLMGASAVRVLPCAQLRGPSGLRWKQQPAPASPAPAPTWQAQDGEVGPALGEARALLHAAAPEPFVLEHGGDRVVV